MTIDIYTKQNERSKNRSDMSSTSRFTDTQLIQLKRAFFFLQEIVLMQVGLCGKMTLDPSFKLLANIEIDDTIKCKPPNLKNSR